MTPADLLAARVRVNPAQPLLTFYDDATGERVELSAATTANWVAKTANLLQDGLGVSPGDPVAVLLPLHWQAAVVLFACWSVGAVVTVDPDDTDVVVAAADGDLEALVAAARDVVGLSLRPLGAPLPTPVPGVTDFAREVLSYPDAFAPYVPVDDDTPALRVGAAQWSARSLVADATRAGGAAPRVLTVRPYDEPEAITVGLLAPLAAGGSVVLCRHPDAPRLAERVRVERVTVTVGVTVAGVPRAS